MTASTKTTKASAVNKATKGKPKAEKIFHPESRKAGQMAREALRKSKLSNQVVKRGKKQMAQADRHAFFLHALPPNVPKLSLEEVHEIVRDIWLTRHDEALQAEQAARRKGRPKSAKEIQLEDMKRYDAEEYRTGFELPDLTDKHTVDLFRKWDAVDVSYLRILRFIRICGEFPDVIHVARIGQDKTATTTQITNAAEVEVDEEMEIEAGES